MEKQTTSKIELMERLRQEFPDLTFNKVDLVNNGDDHAVLILDNRRVVRFPRNEKYTKSFLQELGILQALTKKGVSVPNYDHLSKEKDFGSYEFIQGQELREDLFKSLSKEAQERLAQDIGRFLSAVHELPKDLVTIQNSADWHSNSIWKYSDRYVNERREIIKPFVEPELLQNIDTFFENLRNMKSDTRCIIHSDLTDDHILVDSTGKFAGVIDFGDAMIGDPAFDYIFLWNYGDETAKQIYENYKFKSDEKLLARSYWHYVRFLADSLYFASKENNSGEIEEFKNKLKIALDSLPNLN